MNTQKNGAANLEKKKAVKKKARKPRELVLVLLVRKHLSIAWQAR